MRRGETGHYRITTHGGEEVRSFVPAPLPPESPLRLDGHLLARPRRQLRAASA